MQSWLILLAIAVGVAFVAKKIKQPYPTLLVIAGAAIGLTPGPFLGDLKAYVTSDQVFQTVILLIFLAALLGEASLKLPFGEIRDNRKPILKLALLGTLLTFAIVAVLSKLVLGLPLQNALLFGALMSATDPVSVLSIFKSMGLNKKLSIIVEGESLANDGVAVVLFKIALVTTALAWSSLGNGSWEFVKVVCGGVAIGTAAGFIASRITSKIDDYLVETGLSIVLFYGVFELAEQVHVSGVIAVVFAGLLLGTYGKKIGMSDLTHEKMDSFWEIVAFIANVCIFLMVGLEIAQIDLAAEWGLLLGSIAVVLAARFAAVYVSLFAERGVPAAWKPVIAWGGLKGSLSIALILGVSPEFPGRPTLLAMTFANVLFSLLIQGTTVRKLVDWMNVR